MNEAFNKPYDPKAVEEKIYKKWEESEYFNPDKLPINQSTSKPFTIIMPPPNANGSLHLGHALMITLEDILVRYKRMKGFKTLWLPGADHAGFETQVVYEKKLEKEGRNRFQLSREQLWQEIWDFVQANKGTTEKGLRRLGASCDWSRAKFTLDEDIISKTQDTFIQMYEEGLVYRGERLVNWCIKHKTTLSDLEISHKEDKSKLYFIKYKIKESNDYIVIATTRPETIPADVAIAINPKSKKWKSFLGKMAINPANGKLLPIIKDDAVDESFGTGALKITPYHDHVDYEIYQKHREEIDKWLGGLPDRKPISVIFYNNGTVIASNLLGKLNNIGGLKIKEAREKAAELLKDYFDRDPEDYIHKVAVCYKCNNEIEPRLLSQWFVKMKPLAKAAIDAVKKGKIKFIPVRFKKVYFYWLKNIRDWNISRQIVWGIRIPAWYCLDEVVKKGGMHREKMESIKDWKSALNFIPQPVFIGNTPPKICPKCGGENLIQDPDVFDTWFSSGQWPFLTLQDPKHSNDFKEFYPTDIMETGWDILFFWVARMVMLGLYKTKKLPFKYVYLHGLVRDKDKQKMSKSKGNVVDPLGVLNEYGADALRMALIVGNTPGNDLAYSEDKIRGYRNFANKIWQASRFVLINTQHADLSAFATASADKRGKPKLTTHDKRRLKEFETFRKKITKQMDELKFYKAAEEIYHYFWHTFADKIIEENKNRIKEETMKSAENKAAAQYVLLEILSGCLKLLHPFMPFITEEIYQNMFTRQSPEEIKKDRVNLLMIESW